MRSSRVSSLLALAAGLALGAGRAGLVPGDAFHGLDIVRTWREGDTSHLYRFPLRAGQFVRIAAEQRSSDVTLKILAPGDHEPTFIDGHTYATGTDAFELVAKASGEARVRMGVANAIGNAPTYRLTISAPHPASARERLRAQAFADFEAANGLPDEASIRLLTRALARLGPARSGDLEARIHDRLGRHLEGDYPKALRHFRAAAVLAVESQLAGAELHKLGTFLANRQQYKASAEAYEAERRLGRRSGDLFREAFALGGLAWLAKRDGRFGESLALYRQALSIWRQLGDRERQALTLSALSAVSLDLGDTEQAAAHLETGLGLDSISLALQIDLLDNFALTFRRQEQWDRARQTSERALDLARRLKDREREVSCLLTLGAMELDLGRTKEALGFLRAAERLFGREVENPSYLANLEVMLGVAAARNGNLREAFKRFARSLEGYRRLGNESARAWVLSHRSDALRQADRFDEARWDLEQAIEILESLRPDLEPQKRADLLADRHRFFDRLVDLLIDRDRPEEAFEASERSRARTLLDLVSGRGITPPRSLSEIRAALPAGYVLLDYWLGETRSFVWVVRGEGISWATLPAQKEIERQSREATASLGRPPGRLTRGQRTIAQLSETLLGKIAGDLRAERFVIVPDGRLFAVPFAALPIPGTLSEPTERLIDRAPVVTLPSASLALEIRDAVARRPAAERGMLAVGDPVFGCPDARLACPASTTEMVPSSLPAQFAERVRAVFEPPGREREATSGDLVRIVRTGSEVAAIAELAGGGNVAQRVGFGANRSAVLGAPLEKYRILHFATHGLVDSVRPERSGLALSRLDERGRMLAGDNFLRLGDLAERRLRADLVVLSACESALGRETRGEGPQSLGRAFLAAGAANALVSLWRVDDSSTEQMMVGFYRQLLGRGLPAAVALRQSQLEVRSHPGWSDPYYWGAFVLQGDWRENGGETEKELNGTNGEVSSKIGMSREQMSRRNDIEEMIMSNRPQVRFVAAPGAAGSRPPSKPREVSAQGEGAEIEPKDPPKKIMTESGAWSGLIAKAASKSR